MISFDSRLKIGILGGGQLARMLALEAAPLGLEVHILSEKQDDPAAQVCGQHYIGNPNSAKDLKDFCENLDYLTFESEFFDTDEIEILLNTSSLKVFPSPANMRLIQDRQTQKASLAEAKIPTADFMLVNSPDGLIKAFEKFSGRFVLKKSRGGYDGYGTYYIRNKKDVNKYNSLFPEEFIAEEIIEFKKELAFVIARSADGSIISLPLVETKQSSSRCDWVIGPTEHPKFLALQTKIKKWVMNLNYVGVIAFELFDTGTELLVNEVAPRVHNSAHYSQQFLKQSQFLLHLYCGLGLALKSPQCLSKSFCMINLLGQTDQTPSLAQTTGYLHWYGKNHNRPGRKMGHINYVGENQDSLLSLAKKERKEFKL